MKKTSVKRSHARSRANDELLPEYDFRGARRNPYAKRFARGAIAVVLDPDVARVFGDAAAVNKALRGLMTNRKRSRARRSTA